MRGVSDCASRLAHHRPQAVNQNRPLGETREISRARSLRCRSKHLGFGVGSHSHRCEPRARDLARHRAQVVPSRGLATARRDQVTEEGRQPPRAFSCLLQKEVAPRDERSCKLALDRAIGVLAACKRALGLQSRLSGYRAGRSCELCALPVKTEWGCERPQARSSDNRGDFVAKPVLGRLHHSYSPAAQSRALWRRRASALSLSVRAVC